MKGLLIKDLRLLSKNKKSYAILFAVIIIVFLQQSEGNPAFAIAYIAAIAGIFATNTLSMDENGKSMPFLMTLPFAREVYVAEKYLLSLAATLLGCIVSVLAYIAINAGRSKVVVIEGIAIFVVLSFYHMIMLPLQFKYNDKARIALLMLIAFCIVIGYLSQRTVAHINTASIWVSMTALKISITSFADGILSQNKWVVGIISFLIWLICLAVSFLISREIIRKKEF